MMPGGWIKGCAAMVVICGAFGCDDATEPIVNERAEQSRLASAGDSTTIKVTPAELRRKLQANELAIFQVSGNDIVEASLIRSGIKSIEALRGLPLRGLDLGFTTISDLSPLAGMPLKTLVLEDTSVSDLGPLKGMPLEVLNLQNTKATDFSVLAGMPLKTLNVLNVPFSDLSLLSGMPLKVLTLRGSKVSDLVGLSDLKLISLDLENTPVADVLPLSMMTSLKRLNIAKTQVTDVTPLKGLTLERIVLSPESITAGMEVLRDMKSLVHIQLTDTEDQPVAEFWKRFDLGVWKKVDVP